MSVVTALRARVRGEFEVDAWGLDPEIHDAAVTVGRVRWDVRVDGIEHVPSVGPALFVLRRRVGVSEQAVFAVGVASSTDRRVVSAGIPGVRSAEGVLRRLGGALPHPAEITALVRDGHLVSTGLGWSPLHDAVGPLSAPLLLGPLRLGVPILPVAMRGRELGHRWHVLIGPPVDAPAGAHLDMGTAVEVGSRVRDAVAGLVERVGSS